MARYLLVQVDENDKADRLREKLDAVHGLTVVGMFAKPTMFCECEVKSDYSVRGKAKGWWVCPECRKPKEDALQSALPNLMEGVDTPAKFQNSFLTIREPYLHPLERSGPTAIANALMEQVTNKAKHARRRARRSRAR